MNRYRPRKEQAAAKKRGGVSVNVRRPSSCSSHTIMRMSSHSGTSRRHVPDEHLTKRDGVPECHQFCESMNAANELIYTR